MPRGFQVGQELLAGGIERTLLGGINRGFEECFFIKIEEVRLILEHVGGYQIRGCLLPQLANIERLAGSEVFQARS